jgi:catechol 2,3-dioxygenase-like lactoylglutathione lyase family enzyme
LRADSLRGAGGTVAGAAITTLRSVRSPQAWVSRASATDVLHSVHVPEPDLHSPEISWRGVCLDCADAEVMARFYAEVFGWKVTGRDSPDARLGGSGWICMSGPDGGPSVSFQAEDWYEPPMWPETVGEPTKMMHFEFAVDDLDAAIDVVRRAGGRVAPTQPADRDRRELCVMLDPAGHPFCLCRE